MEQARWPGWRSWGGQLWRSQQLHCLPANAQGLAAPRAPPQLWEGMSNHLVLQKGQAAAGEPGFPSLPQLGKVAMLTCRKKQLL